jgi:hypothetical protein
MACNGVILLLILVSRKQNCEKARFSLSSDCGLFVVSHDTIPTRVRQGTYIL